MREASSACVCRCGQSIAKTWPGVLLSPHTGCPRLPDANGPQLRPRKSAGSKLDDAELSLAHIAQRAAPILGNLRKPCPRCDTFFG